MNRWSTKSEHIQGQQQRLGFTWKRCSPAPTHSLQISIVHGSSERWFVAGFFSPHICRVLFSPFRYVRASRRPPTNTISQAKGISYVQTVIYSTQAYAGEMTLGYWFHFVQIRLKGSIKNISIHPEILSESWDTAVWAKFSPCAFEQLHLLSLIRTASN